METVIYSGNKIVAGDAFEFNYFNFFLFPLNVHVVLVSYAALPRR